MIGNSLTKSEQKIIILLSNYPNREFFCRQIAKKLNISVGGASQTLKKLEKRRLIKSEKQGNMKFYRIIAESPAVRQYKINFTINKIDSFIKKLKPKSLEIVLFGSASRGEQTAGSDIDLFVLTNDKPAAEETIKGSGKTVPIRAIIKTPNEWFELEGKDPEFYNEIKRGIKLHHHVSEI